MNFYYGDGDGIMIPVPAPPRCHPYFFPYQNVETQTFKAFKYKRAYEVVR